MLAAKDPRGTPGLQTDWIPPARSLCLHSSDAALTLSWWLWLWSVRVPMAGCGTCSSGCLAEGGGIHWGGGKKPQVLLPGLALKFSSLVSSSQVWVLPAGAGTVQQVKADYVRPGSGRSADQTLSKEPMCQALCSALVYFLITGLLFISCSLTVLMTFPVNLSAFSFPYTFQLSVNTTPHSLLMCKLWKTYPKSESLQFTCQ